MPPRLLLIYPATHKLVVFLDDNLLGDPFRVRPLLEGMCELGVRWGSQTNLCFADDPELLKLVARSGCIGLFVGIESVTGVNSRLAKSGTRYSQAEADDPRKTLPGVGGGAQGGIQLVLHFIACCEKPRPAPYQPGLQHAAQGAQRPSPG
jgi:hypothetical protein